MLDFLSSWEEWEEYLSPVPLEMLHIAKFSCILIALESLL